MSDYWNEQLLRKRLSTPRQIVKCKILNEIGRFYLYFTKDRPDSPVTGKIIFYPGRS